jgi:hypothetical protein
VGAHNPCFAPTLSPNTGDVSVEFDAQSVDVLRTRIVAKVEKYIDLDALTGQVGRGVS